jgi:glutaredoxin
MVAKRQIEIFSAGCPVCEETIDLVNEMACPSCEISVLDMQDETVAERARSLGVKSVPAIAIDGQLADCCQERGVDKETLSRSGVGQPIS